MSPPSGCRACTPVVLPTSAKEEPIGQAGCEQGPEDGPQHGMGRRGTETLPCLVWLPAISGEGRRCRGDPWTSRATIFTQQNPRSRPARRRNRWRGSGPAESWGARDTRAGVRVRVTAVSGRGLGATDFGHGLVEFTRGESCKGRLEGTESEG